ncbi:MULTISPECIES: helix-turn-helix transcriptional regulator [unclassified Streptomyces]|uniref:ArsR/SmtB family transcription factor n=1 Tax=unclassified Streptomyces TaxID=2593676 RepID=UPI001E654104|nr:winged helix-turn-helix domain-containing protein [Streptomyces sp. CB02980]MCB8906494.1 winged helix-turn-helix domain-containing protein [Streptomyces sp. CB02980]
MLHIHFTAEDMTRVRFTPRPSPVPELHAALLMLGAPHEGLLFGRWRGRLLRTLPGAAEPLAELVPGGAAPHFLDVLGGTREEGFALIRSARPEFVRSELERVYAGQGPVPPWIRALHHGDAAAWGTLDRAQRAAYETVLAPVWPLLQDLHRAEFTRYALTAAEQGLAAALVAVAPGSRLRDGVWEWPTAPAAREVPEVGEALAAGEAREVPEIREIRLDGRGLVLLPTFHWRGGPLVQDLPDRPVVLTYPAGGGIPPTPESRESRGARGEAGGLSTALGRTRTEVLRALTEPRTTTGLARHTGISNATASGHAAALRAAGLIATTRTGRSVHHEQTPLGALLLAGAG